MEHHVLAAVALPPASSATAGATTPANPKEPYFEELELELRFGESYL